jgi:hypothetical protein
MCKFIPIKALGFGRLQRAALPITTKIAVIGLLCSLSVGVTSAQVACVNCPANGTASGVAPGIFLSTTRGGIVHIFSGDPADAAGSCETVVVHTDLGYKATSQGQVGRGYFGGTTIVRSFAGPTSVGGTGPVEQTTDVTPAALASTKIGPVAPAANACGDTDDLALNDANHPITAADISLGAVTFRLDYNGGLTLVVPCTLNAGGFAEATVNVVGAPSCSIAPASQSICVGGTPATFTASSTGPAAGAPVTFAWTGPGGFTATGPTITVGVAGTYTATITDQFGCINTCTATLIVNPLPIVSVNSPTVCPTASGTLTATVTGSTATPFTFAWTGPGGFTSTANPITVSAVGTYNVTVTDANGCVGTGSGTLANFPTPTCSISGPTTVNVGETHTYSNADATEANSWSITGDGSIVGSTTGSSVSVLAGNVTGSYTLTDNITSADGCPGSCTLPVTVAGQPCIVVTKLVTCAPATGIAGCDSSLTYGPSAEGVAGTNNPAFCYSITVSNCGTVQLTGVTVSDSLINAVAGAFPTSLDVGATVTHFFGLSWGVGTHVNTVTASGSGAGVSVTNTSSATVTVVPACVLCTLTVSNDFNLDNPIVPGHVLLPSNAPVVVQLTVTNCGSGDLNVSISPLSLHDCVSGADVSPPASVFLAAGASAQYTGCLDVVCPAGTNLNVSVQGTAVASKDIPCIFDSLGNVISTDVSHCSASVSCQTPVTCRVTGGGTLYTNTFSTNCIVVGTTLFDALADSHNLIVDHISHGGQLGAPFSHMDCANRLGDPCITGQWQHTRHYLSAKNGGGTAPQDVFDMDFHSQTPKGTYDTLDCACLPCCGTTDKHQPAHIAFSNKFDLCNPDDHRICGPMPRPSPANAIIFSGIGTFTPSTSTANGNNAQKRYVIFRVYIEDRSEPGGVHPGGSVQPGDIYCFQAWDTGLTIAKKPDFTSVATAFRTQLSADSCAFLNALSSGGLDQGSLPPATVLGIPADVNDCGPLHDGNQQIHPSTGATCTRP